MATPAGHRISITDRYNCPTYEGIAPRRGVSVAQKSFSSSVTSVCKCWNGYNFQVCLEKTFFPNNTHLKHSSKGEYTLSDLSDPERHKEHNAVFLHHTLQPALRSWHKYAWCMYGAIWSCPIYQDWQYG